MKKFSLLIGWLLYACICQAASLKVFHLTCEHIQNPLGIDQQQPLLSWKLESDERNQYQSAYEILVSTDQDKLEKGKADVWNSGRIKSDETLLIPYAGKKLKSFTRYYWKVRVYNQQGEASDWSETAWWETAMLKAEIGKHRGSMMEVRLLLIRMTSTKTILLPYSEKLSRQKKVFNQLACT